MRYVGAQAAHERVSSSPVDLDATTHRRGYAMAHLVLGPHEGRHPTHPPSPRRYALRRTIIIPSQKQRVRAALRNALDAYGSASCLAEVMDVGVRSGAAPSSLERHPNTAVSRLSSQLAPLGFPAPLSRPLPRRGVDIFSDTWGREGIMTPAL